ncbi:unnamed protein product [Brugia timori]|uniref:Transposase n=1 Tax=Brugia timori TaxID=42155 RepID=A0A0R3Q9Y4_9BILA|nr:unnamed protein product [Brugia timori]
MVRLPVYEKSALRLHVVEAFSWLATKIGTTVANVIEHWKRLGVSRSVKGRTNSAHSVSIFLVLGWLTCLDCLWLVLRMWDYYWCFMVL